MEIQKINPNIILLFLQPNFNEIKDIVMIDTIIESNCIKFTKKYELNINLKCKMMYSEKEGYIACLKSEVGNISKLLFCIHCSTFGNL